ncbi:molybdopterin dinucleotide binding domain-containing protein [Microvirga zambiensis]|uniref:molybdopterin dinucleotide binding domain-containing protein n=1 Tax=Microvirga zambiensis TaxID=1402137 RepID=UPI00191CFEEF|nr:molybdopterin dinucleotide binding domain-containing protein [Microvirga zambiensis]
MTVDVHRWFTSQGASLDIGRPTGAASHRLAEPAGEARDDFTIFSALASRLGAEEAFTEGRNEESWLRHLYGLARQRIAAADMDIPDFDAFWREGVTLLPEHVAVKPLLADFRSDPVRFPLTTPSGLIELFSERIASFGYADCPGHAAWLPSQKWLGAPAADRFPLHLISNQPVTKLHSQYDHGSHARDAKIAGREPIRMNPQDATRRGLSSGDIVRVFNDRGACLAGVSVSNDVRPGVVQLSTGAWFDPLEPGMPGSLDKHGNPNVLTPDRGTSALAQGPSAHSCLVEVQAYDGSAPPVTSYQPPPFLRGSQ